MVVWLKTKPVAARRTALVAGPVEQQHRRVDVQHVAEKSGLAQGRGKGLPEPVHDDQQRSARGFLNEPSDVRDEGGLIQLLHRFELDFLILEPLAGVDDHAQAQRSFNLDIKKPKLEVRLAFDPETLLERPGLAFRAAVRDEEKPIPPLRAQLRDQHTPEKKGLGPLQRAGRGSKIDIVEPDPQPHQNHHDQPQA
jgi:hypothetical protein